MLDHLSPHAGAQQVLDELISKGANVNVAAAGGVTALHIAAESGDVGIVQSLLKVPSYMYIPHNAGAGGYASTHLLNLQESLLCMVIDGHVRASGLTLKQWRLLHSERCS